MASPLSTAASASSAALESPATVPRRAHLSFVDGVFRADLSKADEEELHKERYDRFVQDMHDAFSKAEFEKAWRAWEEYKHDWEVGAGIRGSRVPPFESRVHYLEDFLKLCDTKQGTQWYGRIVDQAALRRARLKRAREEKEGRYRREVNLRCDIREARKRRARREAGLPESLGSPTFHLRIDGIEPVDPGEVSQDSLSEKGLDELPVEEAIG